MPRLLIGNSSADAGGMAPGSGGAETESEQLLLAAGASQTQSRKRDSADTLSKKGSGQRERDNALACPTSLSGRWHSLAGCAKRGLTVQSCTTAHGMYRAFFEHKKPYAEVHTDHSS